MRDYIRQRGAAAFGTRLRRLSERLDREVQAIYRERAIAFEPRWFPIVTALFMASLMLLFGQRRWLGLVLYPIAVTVFIYVLFGMLLRVPL